MQTETIVRDGITFYTRPDTHDATILQQTFGVSYKQYPIQPGWRVIDVGAHIGSFALKAWKAGAEVWAFEPEQENYDLLTRNIAQNGAWMVHAFQDAIMGETGPATLYKWQKSPGNTGSYGMHYGAAFDAPAVMINAITLAEALLLLDGPCDLLKLDCEGAEYGILERCPAGVLGKIKRIIMEWHISVAAAGCLQDRLLGTGFVLDKFNTVSKYLLDNGQSYEYGTAAFHHVGVGDV